MIEKRMFYRIRVKTCDLKRVVSVYETLQKKGLIQFAPAGIFSKYVDVLCENDTLMRDLPKANVPFREMHTCQFYCVDTNEALGYTANHKTDDNENPVCDLVTKEELNSAIASLRTGNCDEIRKEIIDVLASICSDEPAAKPSTHEKTKPELQRKKIRPSKVLDFKTEGRRTKWEIIKLLQGEFEKFPDDTTFGSFTANGIGVFGTRYL